MSTKPLSIVEITLHWIVGLGVIATILVGVYMTETETFALYGVHKSVGMILFVFILTRVWIRLRKGWPEPVSTGANWEHGLARIVHWVLIIATVVMPISGLLDSYMAGHGLSVFGLDLIVASTGDGGKPEAINKTVAEISEVVHDQTGNILIAAILLHVAGALKHHFIDKDSTLRRMLGKTQDTRF